MDSLRDNSSKDEYWFAPEQGIRCAKIVEKCNNEYNERSTWQSKILRKCRKPGYDEIRRLYFVAISRAKHRVLATASKKGHQLFQDVFKNNKEVPITLNDTEDSKFESPRKDEKYVGKKPLFANEKGLRYLSVHAVLEDKKSKSEKIREDMGPEYGNKVHRVAELYANGVSSDSIDVDKKDRDFVRGIVDGLSDKNIQTETECSLPFEEYGIVLNGKIDLIAFGDKEIQIHDWKTDSDKSRRKTYLQQISIYYRALKTKYPDSDIKCYLDWISYGESELVKTEDLLDSGGIKGLVEEYCNKVN